MFGECNRISRSPRVTSTPTSLRSSDLFSSQQNLQRSSVVTGNRSRLAEKLSLGLPTLSMASSVCATSLSSTLSRMKRNHYTWTNIFLQLSPKQKLSSYLHLNDWNKSFNSSRQSTRTTVSAVSGSPGRFIFSAFVIICSYLPSFISFNSSVWFLVITVS